MGFAMTERAGGVIIPLPVVVDTPSVVLASLLMGRGGPMVLDASAVREVQAGAADVLAHLLERADGVRIHRASAALRRRLAGHPLAAYLSADPLPGDDDLLFICPDRETDGFVPSGR